MNKSIYCLAMVAGFALNMSAAQAEPMARKNMDNYFKEMDANSDGVIAKEEFDAMHNRRFQEMDTDRDNKLTREEMRAGHQKAMGKAKQKGFDATDVDKSGALSREELKDMPRLHKNFDRMDADKDGKLTREEMGEAMKKRRAADE